MVDLSENIISLSKDETKKFIKFRELLKKPDNFYSLNFLGGKEKAKNDKKNLENDEFYEKYEHLSNFSGPEQIELEKELAKYISASARHYNCQFIIATHSPILLSYQYGQILDLNHQMQPVRYEDTDVYRIYMDFLNNPYGMQKVLFDE